MPYLITYHWKSGISSASGYAMTIEADPIEWLAEVQKHRDTYILLNAQPITEEQAKKYDDAFKGM